MQFQVQQSDNPSPTAQQIDPSDLCLMAKAPKAERTRMHSIYGLVDFNLHKPEDFIAFKLLETSWGQRLKDIYQLGDTRQVWNAANHTRYEHTFGAVFIARTIVQALRKQIQEPDVLETFERLVPAIIAAAALHDIGHWAPGSHFAPRLWYPGQTDEHEEISVKIIQESDEIQAAFHELKQKFDPNGTRYADLNSTVKLIIAGDPSNQSPTFNAVKVAWQIISGPAINADRIDWKNCDAVRMGINRSGFDTSLLIQSLSVMRTEAGFLELTIEAKALAELKKFIEQRNDQYKLCLHPVTTIAEEMQQAMVERVRDLGLQQVEMDPVIRRVLESKSAFDVALDDVFELTESMVREAYRKWSKSSDPVLSLLATCYLKRKLFKRCKEDLGTEEKQQRLFGYSKKLLLQNEPYKSMQEQLGVDISKYFIRAVTIKNKAVESWEHAPLVRMDDGKLLPLSQCIDNEPDKTPQYYLAHPADHNQFLLQLAKRNNGS